VIAYKLQILRVLSTEKRTNFSVLEEVKPERSLEAAILRLKLHYFGHVMRAEGLLERDMLGRVAGYTRQGKPRMRWLDSTKEATGQVVQEKTRNRQSTNVK